MIEKRSRFEIQPPWIVYSNSSPYWSGWRQGESEFWFCNVWLPFWENLKTDERIFYLEDWSPPADWNLYLAQH
ncbi:hypothetical protein [Leptospira interrogans]|uniref:hypothetical protein n=1 Tax=Leptospira interrogans TaxID=173 RepID=UPI000291F7E1|nr:hypothetical protein [Leptospira interrogans]EKN90207.1 hypothetical protein LEP1GSC027_1555 [Leptospira interrogans str. 2002000624]OOB98925.1 hypothetical protein B0192_08290 [Leptospira interrogans serovar Australis]